MVKVNYDAFKTGTTKTGGIKKEICIKNNNINQIFQIDHQDQITLILLCVLLDPKMHVITKSIITEISTSYNWCEMQQDKNHGESDNDNYILCSKLWGNFKNILQFLKNNGGRWSNVLEQFVRTMFTCFSSPNILSQFSDQTIEPVFGLSPKT